MAIMGSVIIPKSMGHLADVYGLPFSYIVPLVCFVLIALYGFGWSKLSKSEGFIGRATKGGH